MLYVYMFSGWWFQPLWNILVSCYFYSQYIGKNVWKYMESRKTCFFNHQPVICIYRIIHAHRHLDGQKLNQGPPSYWTPPTASQMPFFRCPDDPPVYGMARVYGMHIQLCNIHIYIYISVFYVWKSEFVKENMVPPFLIHCLMIMFPC